MANANPTVWFIAGAKRGVGFEMVSQLLQSPFNVVIGACRTPANANALNTLAGASQNRLHVLALDITDAATITAAAAQSEALVGNAGVDHLVNNAAVLKARRHRSFDARRLPQNPGDNDTAATMTAEDMMAAFQANVVGPALIAQALSPVLARSGRKAIVKISSSMGSVAARHFPDNYKASYAISKAALTMLTGKLADAYPDLTVISMCPGWLQTDMGGSGAAFPVSTGVEGILNVTRELKHDDSGSFFDFTGKRVPW
ncbi:NAD(P)-binding protein [Epithele typhae]|uniref:NAD(P)-binding protein n=1 Tax=Epithele typhae TaxID=378194 RepID=UPI0020088D7A|nr:NAD(P)-binding protein [Epithele typhae]KAH9930408.1 NAD(P)-binding protein [Epithele typhae]